MHDENVELNDIHYFREALSKNLKFFESLSKPRQLAIISLCFVYGVKTLILKKPLIIALEAQDYERAAKEILNENSKCKYIADTLRCDILSSEQSD